MPATNWTPLLWFGAIVVLIPLVLWLLKRTPLGGAGGGAAMRSVGMLPISTSQRIVTIEVGQGDERRWLVLGVTPGSITTLHTMAPPAGEAAPPAAPAPFANLLAAVKLGGTGAH